MPLGGGAALSSAGQARTSLHSRCFLGSVASPARSCRLQLLMAVGPSGTPLGRPLPLQATPATALGGSSHPSLPPRDPPTGSFTTFQPPGIGGSQSGWDPMASPRASRDRCSLHFVPGRRTRRARGLSALSPRRPPWPFPLAAAQAGVESWWAALPRSGEGHRSRSPAGQQLAHCSWPGPPRSPGALRAPPPQLQAVGTRG